MLDSSCLTWEMEFLQVKSKYVNYVFEVNNEIFLYSFKHKKMMHNLLTLVTTYMHVCIKAR